MTLFGPVNLLLSLEQLPIEILECIAEFIDTRSCASWSRTGFMFADALQRLLKERRWSCMEPFELIEDEDAVRWCIRNRPNILQKLFETACQDGRLVVVQMIHGKVDITAENDYAFRWASRNGHLEVVKFLCSFHKDGVLLVDIFVESNYAFRWASENGHLEVVKYLCSFHEVGSPSSIVYMTAAVRWASENDHLEVVKYLCSFYKDGSLIVDNYAFLEASRRGHVEVVKYLCSFRKPDGSLIVNITAENNFALRRASMNGHIEVVKYLCSFHKHGYLIVDIFAENNFAMRWAYEHDHHDVVEYLQYILKKYKIVSPKDIVYKLKSIF